MTLKGPDLKKTGILKQLPETPLPRISNPSGHDRRHSVMIVPPSHRRYSINPINARRTSRNLSIFSLQSNALTTFTGLPIAPQPKIEVENTYKLEPDEGKQFKAHIVRKAAQEVLDEILAETDYMTKTGERKKGFKQWSKASDSSEGGRLAKILVSEVTDKVKTLGMDRYKFVVNAFVGECKGQGLLIASRGLWDTSTDGHVTVECKTATHFAVVVVHAVYYE
uniref:tctex1 domain-containing protein 2 isoform X2 n=1 Tax=Ciona intestinalis TaxID=7719 RepID=UPI000EF4D610|nr:tctex1 domain-containing protein 2 isoform X2 [Ciona intestinalis]|eukprot:XP_026689617.1 tctex1 domain-containing protein 2 isoform X2 [Ciona intestinalis]